MATAKIITPFEVSTRPAFLFTLALLFLAVRFDGLTLLYVLAAILLHESAHASVARLFHIPIRGIEFNGLGIALRRPFVAGTNGAMIALAGPLMTLALAITTHGFVARFNWALFLVSMLPLPITDLGHAWKALQKA